MALALWFLLRSMTRRLRKVGFEEEKTEAARTRAPRPGAEGDDPRA